MPLLNICPIELVLAQGKRETSIVQGRLQVDKAVANFLN
jgi:hypothetical protein